LRGALEREELLLHYQPKQDLGHGGVSGVEALLRWQHPERGLLLPSNFIPLAEETGLIVPIGKWVIETACAQNVAWQRQGLPALRIAVNLSPRQLADPGLLSDIATALDTSGMAPKLLELEITESMVMQNVERAMRVLTAIKRLGVILAIDDFGTGYSSMSLLKKFPIDVLKIDRSFVREITSNSEDKAIADAIIALGRVLNLTIVAEGVETAEQEAFLRAHNCDEVQGYLISKPVPADEFAAFMANHMLAELKAHSAKAS
jgi:EAL domain-containing protein (putative c-di-GMP-specific phosphodiesterase class I)